MNKLSFDQKRIIVGIASLIPLFCLTSYFMELHIFGRFDKKAVIGSFVFIAIILNNFGPTLHEMQEHRDAKRVAGDR